MLGSQPQDQLANRVMRFNTAHACNGTGNVNYYVTAFSGHLEFPEKHHEMNPFFPQRTHPCPGTEILSSQHFPEDWQRNNRHGSPTPVLG